MAAGHVLLFAFLIGCVCGLRSMTAPAVVAWGAHLGWLPLEGSFLVFFRHIASVIVFSLLALGELVADKLPSIPSRTKPGPLGARIVFGALCGGALAVAGQAALIAGLLLGAIGAVVGAFAGHAYRARLSTGARGRDLLLAVIEDAVAVGGGLLLVSHL